MEENSEFKGGMITEEALEKIAGGLDIEEAALLGFLTLAGVGIAAKGIGAAAKGLGDYYAGKGTGAKGEGKGKYYDNKK